MAHLHTVNDDDLYFRIDPQSKSITYLGEDPLVIAQTDHNSEYFTFEMPRYIEGHDMMLCNKVEVHYINIGATGARSADVHNVKDLQVSADDENTVMFTWRLIDTATKYVGSLNFAIRFACMTGSKVDYSWRTGAYSGISVIESYDNANVVVAQYSDVLQEWYMELLLAGTEGINIIEAATNEAIERIKNIDVVVEVEKETLDRIEAAGDKTVSAIDTAKKEAINEIQKEIYTGEIDLISTIPVYNGDVEVME